MDVIKKVIVSEGTSSIQYLVTDDRTSGSEVLLMSGGLTSELGDSCNDELPILEVTSKSAAGLISSEFSTPERLPDSKYLELLSILSPNLLRNTYVLTNLQDSSSLVEGRNILYRLKTKDITLLPIVVSPKFSSITFSDFSEEIILTRADLKLRAEEYGIVVFCTSPSMPKEIFYKFHEAYTNPHRNLREAVLFAQELREYSVKNILTDSSIGRFSNSDKRSNISFGEGINIPELFDEDAKIDPRLQVEGSEFYYADLATQSINFLIAYTSKEVFELYEPFVPFRNYSKNYKVTVYDSSGFPVSYRALIETSDESPIYSPNWTRIS